MKKLKKNTQNNDNFFFLLIMYHSYDDIKKMIIIKKLNKNEPLMIKNIAIGIKIIELNILFCSSLLIIFYQNFF